MPLVTFQPSGKSASVSKGTELLDAAIQSKTDIATPCGGKGTCGKCIVHIVSGEVDISSTDALSETDLKEGYVQACRTKVLDTPVNIIIPEQIEMKYGRTTDGYIDIGLINKDLFPKPSKLNPLAAKLAVDVPEPMPEDGFSDVDRLSRTLQLKSGTKKEFVYPIPVIRNLADMLRSNEGKVTATIFECPDHYRVIKVEYGDRVSRQFGIAVDIGTTTVSVLLIDQSTPEIIAVLADYNAQIKCGIDIISRINYASRADRLEELRLLVLSTVNKLINQACKDNDIDTEEIICASISGNTTMIHLLLGLKPEYIRLEPYTPTLLGVPDFAASEIGIEIHPESRIQISPAVGSYVGGDITAGLLCTELSTNTDEINLFIDIGTNGEIVIGNSEFLLTCACSAGPAFEGGGIEDGMRAAIGAIEHVDIDRATGSSDWSTIGDVKPSGICGSGMISLLANLLLTGWMDPAGKLDRSRKSPNITYSGRQALYNIVPAEGTSTSKPIRITESDIANIIRAKAAIYSACCLMLDQIGIGFGDIANVYIAGGFGRNLDLQASTILGLIPDLPPERFRYVGNASLIGSYMILISREYREKQMSLANRMTYIDLSKYPNYMDQYTAAQFIPHTDLGNFPSVKELLKEK
jgi:uncharacterized 2Fe-2S/4Fe-4S cluster protein (DUF4445 family)